MKYLILTTLIFLTAFTLNAQINNTNKKVTIASQALLKSTDDKTSSDKLSSEYEQSRAVKTDARILYKTI